MGGPPRRVRDVAARHLETTSRRLRALGQVSCAEAATHQDRPERNREQGEHDVGSGKYDQIGSAEQGDEDHRSEGAVLETIEITEVGADASLEDSLFFSKSQENIENQ